MWVRTAPRDAERFCWRIDVMPRLAQLAGLEIGTGVHLNVLAPEDAAERLRAREPVAFRAAMPPVPRQVPMFAAEPPAGAAALRALGRGARRAVRRARPRTEIEAGADRLVPGPHLERAHLRARHRAPPRAARCSATSPTPASTRAPRRPTSTPRPTSPRRPPSRTPTGRSTSPTRRSATGAAPRAGAGWSRWCGAWRSCRTAWRRPPSSVPPPPTSARWSTDRFTLVSLDAYTGDYVEVRLFGARGAELARESLYEDE